MPPGYGLKVAVTVVSGVDELMVIEHVPGPVQPPPDHPVKVAPL